MGHFSSSLVGVTFDGRQERIALLSVGQKLFWKHESDNVFDENAIRVYADQGLTIDIGHVRKALAAKMIDRLKKKDCDYELYVEKLTGGGELNRGVVVMVATKWAKR